MKTERLPWWVRLNRALLPYLGPPPLGPYDEPEQPASGTKPCPMCGGLMADHDMDRAPGRPTYMRCPVQRSSSPSSAGVATTATEPTISAGAP